MLKYKNLKLAFIIQIIIGVLASIAVYSYGAKGFIVLAFIALRPLLLEKDTIGDLSGLYESFYKMSKFAIVSTAVIMILFYLIDYYIMQSNWLNENKYNVVMIIIPVFILCHGIFGLLLSATDIN